MQGFGLRCKGLSTARETLSSSPLPADSPESDDTRTWVGDEGVRNCWWFGGWAPSPIQASGRHARAPRPAGALVMLKYRGTSLTRKFTPLEPCRRGVGIFSWTRYPCMRSRVPLADFYGGYAEVTFPARKEGMRAFCIPRQKRSTGSKVIDEIAL